jgi:23S rRNA (guanosine2251-2'-O)-methyltransferase
LRGDRRIYRIMLAEEADGPGIEEIARLASARGITLQRVARTRLDSLADHHQGVIADGAPYAYADFEALLGRLRTLPAERPAIVLAVDALQDPQNFGTLLRTAAAVGASGVLLPERRSVGVTPAVGRASAGAIEHLSIARVVNLSRALKQLKEVGLWVVGLDAGADQVYDQADLTVPLAIVVGAEGPGLSRLIGESCDLKVRLPLVGAIDALNAAVAGSIVLYEALRQRRAAQRQ